MRNAKCPVRNVLSRNLINMIAHVLLGSQNIEAEVVL